MLEVHLNPISFAEYLVEFLLNHSQIMDFEYLGNAF